MQTIKTILRNNSNAGIAAQTGYPESFIHKLRKNEIGNLITIDKDGRGIPSRTVLENKILEKFNKKR